MPGRSFSPHTFRASKAINIFGLPRTLEGLKGGQGSQSLGKGVPRVSPLGSMREVESASTGAVGRVRGPKAWETGALQIRARPPPSKAHGGAFAPRMEDQCPRSGAGHCARLVLTMGQAPALHNEERMGCQGPGGPWRGWTRGH